MTTDADFNTKLEALDLTMFRSSSQTSAGDQKSLLAVQSLIRGLCGEYVYLEVGSHLGGTLGPYVLDSRCKLIYSIDPRPLSQPDERSIRYDYIDNSTSAMMAALANHFPGVALDKLVTFDRDARELTEEDMIKKPDLVFIDGEHTVVAVFRDFLYTLKLAKPSSLFIFHDANLIFDGLLNIETYLTWAGIAFASYFLPDQVFAVALGNYIRTTATTFEAMAYPRSAYVENSRHSLWDTIADLREKRLAQRASTVGLI